MEDLDSLFELYGKPGVTRFMEPLFEYEKEKEYPEATMWGVLPAKGFFVNHARNAVFENVEVETIKQDERPVFIKLDAE